MLTARFVQPIFNVVPVEDWVLMRAMGMLPFVVMELVKVLRRR